MFASQPINRGSSSSISRKLSMPKNPKTGPKRLSTDFNAHLLELPADVQRTFLDFKKQLKTHIAIIPEAFKEVFNLPYDGQLPLSLEEMEQRFKALDKMIEFIDGISNHEQSTKETFFKKGEKDKLHLAIEQYKLAILETTLSHIKKRYHLRKVEVEEKEKESSVGLNLFYDVIAVGGGMAAAADGILAAMTMFSGIASSVMLPLTIATAWINLRLYRAVELSSLKEEFGLESGEHIDELMKTKQKQVDVTAKINSCVLGSDVVMKRDNTFVGYANLAKAAHASIIKQSEKTKDYQETVAKRAGRWALGGFGAAIMGAFGYFSIQEAVIGLLAVGVAFTPPGWAILGMSIFAAVCTGIAYLYAVQGLGLFNMLNPQASAVKGVKASYDAYKIDHQDFDANIKDKLEDTIQQRDLYSQVDQSDVQSKKTVKSAVGTYASAGLFSKRDVAVLDDREVVRVGKSFAI